MRLRQEFRPIIAGVAAATIMRSIPEAISYPYLVGHDTLLYAGVIHKAQSYADLVSFFPSPLLPILLYTISKMLGPVAIMKLYPPIAYGALAAALFLFARTTLRMNGGRSFLSTMFVVLQFGMLRVSWDLHRNVLGMILLLLLLSLIHGPASGRSFVASAILATLIFLTHELTSFLMVAIMVALLLLALIKRERCRLTNIVAVLTVSVMATAYMAFIHPHLFSGIFATYTCSDMVKTVPFLFVALHLPLAPFIILGYRANRVQLAWLLITTVAGLSPILSPFAFALWDRWLIMTVPQTALLAGEGASKLVAFGTLLLRRLDASPKRLGPLVKAMQLSIPALLLAPSAYLAHGFMAYPSHRPFWYYDNPTLWRAGWSGIPSTMLSNTLALADCSDAIRVISELNSIMNQSDVVLANTVFHGWLLLYLDKQRTMMTFDDGYAQPAVAAAKAQGYKAIYLVWFVQSSGWHEPGPELSMFKMVFHSGIIAAYLYQES